MVHIMPWAKGDTRDRMVTSAALLLRERGVAGTSFAKVLQHSGAPRGSVSHHFPGGKDEMVADAVRLAGSAAASAMRCSIESGDSPAQLFGMVCRFYRKALVDSEFSAACPVGAVAAEAHDDPELREAVAEVFTSWHRLIAQALVTHGHTESQASELADVCIAALEGGLMLARVQASPAPIDGVQNQLSILLEAAVVAP